MLSFTNALRAARAPIQRVPAAIAATSRRGYHEKDMRLFSSPHHYQTPRNPGSLDKSDIRVGTGLVGAPACGDVMKLQIQVENGTITDAKFKTFGCGSAIASSSAAEGDAYEMRTLTEIEQYATELIKGMTLEQAAKIRNADIAQNLHLPPVKLHCSMLAEDAIRAAIADFQKKNLTVPVTDLGTTEAKSLEK